MTVAENLSPIIPTTYITIGDRRFLTQYPIRDDDSDDDVPGLKRTIMGEKIDSAVYEIRIQGYLSRQRESQFEGMAANRLPDGVTILIGPVSDQAALYGLLARVRDLGMPLLSVQHLNADDDREGTQTT